MTTLKSRVRKYTLLWAALAAVGLPALLIYNVVIGNGSPWPVIIGWAALTAWGFAFGLVFVVWFAKIDHRRRR